MRRHRAPICTAQSSTTRWKRSYRRAGRGRAIFAGRCTPRARRRRASDASSVVKRNVPEGVFAAGQSLPRDREATIVDFSRRNSSVEADWPQQSRLFKRLVWGTVPKSARQAAVAQYHPEDFSGLLGVRSPRRQWQQLTVDSLAE
jgi:hypothetical protein